MLGQLWMPGAGARWKYDSSTPAATPGLSVTFGVSNAEGSWVQIATSANIAQDVYGFMVECYALNSTGYSLNATLEVGVDPAGGSSYTSITGDLLVGASVGSATQGAGATYYFPLFIKSGSSVAVRGSTSYTSGTGRVRMVFFGRPARPELVRVGQYCEQVGAITNNVAVSFTPGNGAEGSWASLGTTTRPCWWAQLCVGHNTTAMTAVHTYVDLAVGDGTNYDIIIENYSLYGNTAEYLLRNPIANLYGGHWEIPAGATLYVRGWCHTTVVSGWNARAVLVGG